MNGNEGGVDGDTVAFLPPARITSAGSYCPQRDLPTGEELKGPEKNIKSSAADTLTALKFAQ